MLNKTVKCLIIFPRKMSGCLEGNCNRLLRFGNGMENFLIKFTLCIRFGQFFLSPHLFIHFCWKSDWMWSSIDKMRRKYLNGVHQFRHKYEYTQFRSQPKLKTSNWSFIHSAQQTRRNNFWCVFCDLYIWKSENVNIRRRSCRLDKGLLIYNRSLCGSVNVTFVKWCRKISKPLELLSNWRNRSAFESSECIDVCMLDWHRIQCKIGQA